MNYVTIQVPVGALNGCHAGVQLVIGSEASINQELSECKCDCPCGECHKIGGKDLEDALRKAVHDMSIAINDRSHRFARSNVIVQLAEAIGLEVHGRCVDCDDQYCACSDECKCDCEHCACSEEES